MSGYGEAAAAAAAVGESSVLRSVRRVFTDAEVKALPSTGVITLLAAPAAGKFYLIHAVSFVVLPWVAAYTNLAAGAQLKIYAVAGFSNTFNGANALFNPGSGFMLMGRADSLFGIEYAFNDAHQFENQSIKFSLTNGANGNLTGGDPGNRLVVTCWYLEQETGLIA